MIVKWEAYYVVTSEARKSHIPHTYTAKSMQGSKGKFWIGILVMMMFTSLILVIQLLMGEPISGQVSVGLTPTTLSIVSGIYYLAAFIAGYYWLIKDSKIQQK